jgi:formamidopyrimidine-DNA glycosylase
MPELPEVETIARVLRPDLIGKVILGADLLWERTLATPSPRQFKRLIKGKKIERIARRGKFLNLELSNFREPQDGSLNLLIHLRMSGDLWIKPGTYEPEKHDRLILWLSEDKSLIFNDTRKFGRVWLTTHPAEVYGNLGPEPLDSSLASDVFYKRLHAFHRQLKPLLLDQSFLAGIGNIYADEALHVAKLHPLIRSDAISRRQAKVLLNAIRTVLQEGIRHNGASIDWVYRGGEFQNHFRVYDRQGEPCQVCGTSIQRIVVGQRGTHLCPHCQPHPR